MARKRYTVEQIIHKLREPEVELAAGKTVPPVARKLGVAPSLFRSAPVAGVEMPFRRAGTTLPTRIHDPDAVPAGTANSTRSQ